jgi:hypothetical protein
MNKFNYLIYLDHNTILSMLKYDNNKPGAHIWHISAIQILASAIEYDIPIGDDLLYNSNPENKNKKFITSFEANKDICGYLIKLLGNNKTPVQNAAIELIAKILNYYQINEPLENVEIESQTSSYLQNNGLNGVNNKGGNKLMNNKYYAIMFRKLSEMSITTNDKVSVNTIFRAGIQYPMFISNTEIFQWSLNMLKKAKNKQRNLIFNTLSSFMVDIVERVINKVSMNEISDMSFIDDLHNNLFQLRNQIFIDPDDELINNLVNMMNQFILLGNKKIYECS